MASQTRTVPILFSITFAKVKVQPRPSSLHLPVKTISVDVSKGQIKLKVYKRDDFKIEARKDTENKLCPLYRHYNYNNFLIVHFKPSCPSDAILQFLKEGLEVCYKDSTRVDKFVFLGHSASQIRTRTCILYNQLQGTVENVLKRFGDFGKIKDVAKRAARIGLLFSTAETACNLADDGISVVEDVERDKHTFTDGCGFISVSCAEKVVQSLKLDHLYSGIKSPPVPSVFQIRLKGCKGVLALSPSLEKGIQIRPSMEKFDWLPKEPHPLGIVDKGYSRPYEIGSLNKQFIMLLSALGIPDEVFLHKQKRYFQELQDITRNHEVAFRYLCAHGEFEMAERLIQTKSLDKPTEQKLKNLRAQVQGSQHFSNNPFEKAKKSAAQRLKIPIEESRSAYGVCDPSGQLAPGTVFFQPTVREEPKILHDVRVVVAKNPSYHKGDIRVLTCGDVTECHHLVDCIVFPTQGSRPHPDEIAGSDLDGDKYFICWDCELVPQSESEPCSYPGAPPKKKDRITREEFLKYFAMYSNATVGKLNNLFEIWADAKGIDSVECELIAALFSRAIDAAKTGERVHIPPSLCQGPQKRFDSREYVWNKLFAAATLFESDRLLEYEDTSEVSWITEDTLIQIISNPESRCSEYRVFRFVYKWCQSNQVDISRFLKCINFLKFSPPQQRLADIDLSGSRVDMKTVMNPLHQSQILSSEDLESFRVSSTPHSRCSLVYRAEGPNMSWSVLGNILSTSLQKVLLFKFVIGGIEWIIVINVSTSLTVGDVVTLGTDDGAAEAHVSVHTGTNDRHTLKMENNYSFAWGRERLDIYKGKKANTFIFFGKEEDHDHPVMSVALDQFNSSFPRKHGVRLRKEKLIAIEVFCVYAGCETPAIIHQTGDVPGLEQVQETSHGVNETQDDFYRGENDFPRLGATAEELMGNLEKQYVQMNSLIGTKELTTEHIVQLYDEMVKARGKNDQEAYEIACHLESFMWRSQLSLEATDQYKQLILTLLGGMKDLRLDAVLGESKGLHVKERVRRCLDSLWTNGSAFTLEELYNIFDAVLMGDEYTYAIGIVKLLREGYFPLDGLEFHPNALPYFLHWTSLVLLESLEEIKQSVLAAQTVKSRSQILARAIEGDKDKGNYTLLVSNGKHSFRTGDRMALCRSDLTKRDYVAEVKSAAGNVLMVDVVWPVDRGTGQVDITLVRWRLHPFPSLIGFRRTLAALQNLPDMHRNSVLLFENLVGSFEIAEDYELQANEGTREEAENKASLSSASGGSAAISLPKEHIPLSLDDQQASWPSGNTSQVTAVRSVIAQVSGAILIQGPPGTGKTITCAEIVHRWLLQGFSPVLLAAETNEGVDNLVNKLIQHGIRESDILRVGSSGWKVAKEIEPLTLEYRYNKETSEKKKRPLEFMDKKVVKRIIKTSKVICTTCIGAGSAAFGNHVFTKVLIDEATQATEPSVLVPLSHGCKQLVLVGDDKQLPPMVQCQLADGLSQTLFTRLHSSGTAVHLLDTQYRMHPWIAAFSSAEFYDGKLKDGVSAQDRTAPKGFQFPTSDAPVAFLKMPNNSQERAVGSSKFNEDEAKEVARIVTDLLEAGDVTAQQVGVVTPYKAQVTKVKEILKNLGDVSVRTVDGFQGQERDVIVFSAVRCNEHHYVGFLDDTRRMNVLLTRARRGLIVIGNPDTLRTSESWRKWLDWVEKNKFVCEPPRTCQGAEGRDHVSNSETRGRPRNNNERGRATDTTHGRYRGARQRRTDQRR